MSEILQSWLRTRLGVLMDLRPEIFGHYTRDGTLLAQILHSYDIISHDQLETIIHTQDPALCRVNLKHLRVWLKFLGIDCDDECIEEISCGKGTTALRVFYRVYLCLENKDRLHFITLQKERERYIPTSTKFDVSKVCEDPPPYEPSEHPLAKRLCETRDTIEWHREKRLAILRGYKKERERFEATRIHPVFEINEHYVGIHESSPITEKKQESAELDEFARKHRPHTRKSTQIMKLKFDEEITGPMEDPAMSKAYVDCLKSRAKRTATLNALKYRMQKTLLSELWEKLAAKQDHEIDETIARGVLDQSQYEKRIVTRLCEIREHKNVIAENRKIVEDLLLKAKEDELHMDQERKDEFARRESEDVDVEFRRMCELRCKIHDEKIRKLHEKHRRICSEIIDDLFEFVVKVAEYRAANDGYVPQTILSEWKASFLKCQPILEASDIPVDLEFKKIEEKEEEPERTFQPRFEEIEAFGESTFQNYHETNPPWDEFVPSQLDANVEEILRLGELVLGYIVHRLLEFLYPRSRVGTEPLVPRYKTMSVILGIGNSDVHEFIQALLDESQIRLIRPEDAINHCLASYKNEMKDTEYIDLNVIEATKAITKALGSEKKSKIDLLRKTPTTSRSKKTELTKISSRQTKGVEEKQTQTPRNIPYDDMHPVLTDTAFIGKWTYEFLTLGEPISNELMMKILIEYLKSLTDIEGWVLIDYPNTYDQMARLENALTGRQIPQDPELLDFKNVNIEDIDPLWPRIIFEDAEVDVFALNRNSRLLPNPLDRQEDQTTTSTYLTTYVKVILKPKNMEIDKTQSYEILTENATSVDKFYANQEIAYIFYYTTFDISTLKKLASLVIHESSRKTSDELSGDVPEELKITSKQSTLDNSGVFVRRLVFEAPPTNFQTENTEENEGKNIEAEERVPESDIKSEEEIQRGEVKLKRGQKEENAKEKIEKEGEKQEEEEEKFPRKNLRKGNIDSIARAIEPGEKGWQWIDLPLPSFLLETLANLWENLEETYIEDLKEILLLKYIHSMSVIPYKDFLTRNMRWFIENRPDNKQNLLDTFHRMFNDIDEDAREDVDVKCELHRRIADFQSELWEICDERRHEAENERKSHIDQHWTVLETVILYNVYVGIVQAEIDRCVDTMQLINDYYIGMLRREFSRESPFSKILLPRIEMNDEYPLNFHEKPGGELSEKSTARKEGREKTKSKSTPSRAIEISTNIDRTHLENEITDLLVDVNKKDFDPDKSIVYNAIVENIRRVRAIVETISSTAKETIKKETAALLRSGKKEAIARKKTPDANQTLLTNREADFAREWSYAAMYEIERIRFRLDMLTAAARADVTFLLDTMRQTFHQIYDNIVDRYKRELKSVNDMANVFCLAVEEGKRIDEEMLLDGDRFIVRRKASSSYKSEAPSSRHVKESIAPWQFQMARLFGLLEIFRRVGPRGILNERSLIYVLQDMISHGNDENEETFLPCTWHNLKSTDVPKLVSRIFHGEHQVDWREFLLYATDLPMPSNRELLRARKQFRSYDPELTETVTRDHYDRTPLWFINESEVMSQEFPRSFRGNFEASHEEFYEDELDIGSSMISEETLRSRRLRDGNSLEQEDITRLKLAKELLCQMYLIDDNAINYTALLLAFCKDEDPRKGFAKALTLAIGNPVCSDVGQGEKYVEGLLELKRRNRETESLVRQEVIETTESAVDHSENENERNVPATSHDRNSMSSQRVTSEATGTNPTDLLHTDQISSENFTTKSGSLLIISNERERSTSTLSASVVEDEESIVYWIPRDICLTVLAATLPWHVSQPDLFQTSRSLRDGIALVYEELRDEMLNDYDNVILAHRLLNHDFILKLLNSTSKFTVKNLGNLVQEILQEGKPANPFHSTHL